MKKHTAFLLFEVMVAILIASTALVVLLQSLSGALRGGAAAKNYFRAEMLTEAKLALLEKETSVKKGTASGKFSDDIDPEGVFSWEQRVTPIDVPGLTEEDKLPVCETEVTVSWKDKNGKKSFRLVTYLQKEEESGSER